MGVEKSWDDTKPVVGAGAAGDPIEAKYTAPKEGKITGYQIKHNSGATPVIEVRSKTGGTLGSQTDRLLEITVTGDEELDFNTARVFKNHDAPQITAIYVLCSDAAAFNFDIELHGET